ncbi:MAG TPA: ElyC/SanA/YdcF family protein [Polyangia bacterium]|nr:ElyC/SanA/YdcF family protein [Polyangia bacterium]
MDNPAAMFLKKLISYCLQPFPLSLTLLILGATLLWFLSRQRLGRILVTVAVGLLLFISWEPTSHWILTPLSQYPPLTQPAVTAAGARWVVVLAGGYDPSPGLPPTSRLSGATLERLVEGIRIHRALPGSKLLMSGGMIPGHEGEVAESEIMVQAAEVLGVPRAETAQENRSLDTRDEALFVRDLIGNDRFVLVTSIMHLPRSMKLFQKVGMAPIPAPAGYGSDAISLAPSVSQVALVEAAQHEYFGTWWSRLRGQI